jgi:hypothetical protein
MSSLSAVLKAPMNAACQCKSRLLLQAGEHVPVTEAAAVPVLQEEVQRLEVLHKTALESLEQALGSLEAEKVARYGWESDAAVHDLVQAAIVSGAEETVTALKKEVEAAEAREIGEFR